jgi:hypothetical protein
MSRLIFFSSYFLYSCLECLLLIIALVLCKMWGGGPGKELCEFNAHLLVIEELGWSVLGLHTT